MAFGFFYFCIGKPFCKFAARKLKKAGLLKERKLKFLKINSMVKSKILEVVLQSRIMFQRMTDENGQDKKEPTCYILLREQGGSDNLLKDEFWCKVMGEMALQRFNPGQKVAVQLHFHAKKNGHKYMQRIRIINLKMNYL